MMSNKVTAQSVKAANRRLYDAIADRYEEIDGRRSSALDVWLRKNLANLRQQAPGENLLDIGTGSGFVTRCATGFFSMRVGIDLSSKILIPNQKAFELGITADVDYLPFTDSSFDVITCFAVLHHLYAFESLVSEITRVLKPRGIFYSDHDMDAAFSKRFALPLQLYRKFHNASSKYRKASENITQVLYDLTEFQEKGIDSPYLSSLFRDAGFLVKNRFHWFGLTPITNRLFGVKTYSHRWAPLCSVLAIKTG